MSNMPNWLVPEDDRSIPTGALWRQCIRFHTKTYWGSCELYVYKYIVKKIYDKKSTSTVEVLLPVFYLRTN